MLGRLFAGLALFLLATAQAAAQEIPFRLLHNMLLVPVEVNGVKVEGWLDTGAPVSIAHPALAVDLKLGLVETGSFSGVAGRTKQFSMVQPVDVRIGDRTLKSAPLMIAGLASLAPERPDHPRMTIGMDLVGDLVMEIDFDRSLIRFTPSAEFRNPPPTKPIELNRTRGGRWIPGSLSGYSSMRVSFDTGNPGAGHFAEYVSRKALKGQKGYASSACGIDGCAPRTNYAVPSLTVGGVAFENVPVDVSPETGRDGEFGIGMDIVKRFNLVLDFPRNRIWMTPNGNRSAPFRRNRVGIEVYSATWPAPVLVVASGSPADRAGFKPGEIIADVKTSAGVPVDELADPLTGVRLVFTMSDGARRELVTEDY